MTVSLTKVRLTSRSLVFSSFYSLLPRAHPGASYDLTFIFALGLLLPGHSQDYFHHFLLHPLHLPHPIVVEMYAGVK
jgi:hypothetical protein